MQNKIGVKIWNAAKSNPTYAFKAGASLIFQDQHIWVRYGDSITPKRDIPLIEISTKSGMWIGTMEQLAEKLFPDTDSVFIVSISIDGISPEMHAALSRVDPEYTDNHCGEHIYNVGNLIDEAEESEDHPLYKYIIDLQEIKKVCEGKQTNYFRIH